MARSRASTGMGMAHSARRVVPMLALFLVAAACGDDGGSTTIAPERPPATTSTAPATTTTLPAATTTTVPAGGVVTSDDGRVTIEVPAGAGHDDGEIVITALPADEHPEEIAALGGPAWLYSLEPDALRFEDPVRMTVEIPFEEFAGEAFGDAVPLATLLVTRSDGTGWEPLGDQAVGREGGTVVLSGTVDHFSNLAVLSEQVFIETRLVEVTRGPANSLGIDFWWSNGAELQPPGFGAVSFSPEGSSGIDSIPAVVLDGGVSIQCPPGVTTLSGDLSIGMLLRANDGTTGEAGVVSAPRLTGLDGAQVTFEAGIELICRPTIAGDGGIQIDIRVDHPGGEVIIPDEDFRGGLSAMLLALARAFPGLFVGLIRDIDGDGVIDPEDVMFPPVPATVDGDTTSAVVPLFGYGDYFLYLLDGEPPPIQTQVTVRDGAAILLGGLDREQMAVPFLGDVPLLGRVFSEESSQSEEAELVILVTAQIVEGQE